MALAFFGALFFAGADFYEKHRNDWHTQEALLASAIASDDSIVAKNALAIAAEQSVPDSDATTKTSQAALDRLNDSNLRVRLNALLALQNSDATPAVVQAVIKAYPALTDEWLQSAAAGVASKAPAEFIAAALASGDPALNSLVAQLAGQIARRGDAAVAAHTLIALAALPDKPGAAKAVVLETIARDLPASVPPPAWSSDLQKAFQTFLAAPAGNGLAVSALPLIAGTEPLAEAKFFTRAPPKSNH